MAIRIALELERSVLAGKLRLIVGLELCDAILFIVERLLRSLGHLPRRARRMMPCKRCQEPDREKEYEDPAHGLRN